MKRFRPAWPLLGLALLAAGCATPPSGAADPFGPWTLAEGVAAPWAPEADPSSAGGLRGATLRFAPGRVVGPPPLACAAARYEYALTPAEGLFQGALPAPADRGALALGVTRLPVLTLQVTCDGGVFDYHLLDASRAVTGLDGVVWRLESRSLAAAPEAVVVALLREHMTGDMGFTPESVARKRPFLSAELARAIADYFDRPVPEDEVPPIDGDPFTDSQEYPSRFTLGASAEDGAAAAVPVSFGDGLRARSVEFALRRDGARWLLDDLRFEDGGTLRALLR